MAPGLAPPQLGNRSASTPPCEFSKGWPLQRAPIFRFPCQDDGELRSHGVRCEPGSGFERAA